jgi:hypothetical protein
MTSVIRIPAHKQMPALPTGQIPKACSKHLETLPRER